MPDFVAFGEMREDGFIEEAVSVGQQADAHGFA
jgi:hypothetical protein